MKDYSIYLVIKHGVYIQGIFGVYDNYNLAKKALKEAQELESDDYHLFYLIGTNVNKVEYIEDNIMSVFPQFKKKRTIVNRIAGIEKLLIGKTKIK